MHPVMKKSGKKEQRLKDMVAMRGSQAFDTGSYPFPSDTTFDQWEQFMFKGAKDLHDKLSQESSDNETSGVVNAAVAAFEFIRGRFDIAAVLHCKKSEVGAFSTATGIEMVDLKLKVMQTLLTLEREVRRKPINEVEYTQEVTENFILLLTQYVFIPFLQAKHPQCS
jgi:hypothetical protein